MELLTGIRVFPLCKFSNSELKHPFQKMNSDLVTDPESTLSSGSVKLFFFLSAQERFY